MSAGRRPADPRRGAVGLRIAAVLGVALLGAWLGGLIWFTSDLDAPSSAPDTVTDAIVVLTGGAGRLDAGLDLLRAGKARKLFISGVPPGVTESAEVRLTRNPPAWITCCVVLGHEAGNTIGNAVETAAWLRREGYRSLRLVTANYHMRRALLEFRRALPPDTRIVPEPVLPDFERRAPWWRWRGSERVVLVEYTKYLFALVRPLIGGWPNSVWSA
jgi:uncharacterized SAM-binding protein YcdF (DUF218 family)